MTQEHVWVLPLVDEGLGNSAYLVDLGDGGALAVDPDRLPGRYLDAAAAAGLTIRAVAETHLHADFVSGGRELARHGAQLYVPAAGGHAFEHIGLAHGDEVELGGLTLRAIGTPGHTPEHLAYLLLDDGVPVALFSGGSLMAGGVARPDLVAPDQTEPLARAAYRSLTGRLLTLPDDLVVYPTHGGGSFCASGPGGRRTTTIGAERTGNPLLQAAGEDAFVERLLAGLGSFPPYFLRLREVNRRGPRVSGSPPPLTALSPAEVAAAAADGAAVVDARPIARFAAGHVPGSISIELRPSFPTWLGWLVPFDQPVVVILDDDQPEAELVGRALTVGYERLVGRLDGGLAAWRGDGRPVATIRLLAADEAAREVAGQATVVDVRQASEWSAGHLPGATHRELGALTMGPTGLAGPLLVHCNHGQRAMSAASLLARAGVTELAATTAGPRELLARLEQAG